MSFGFGFGFGVIASLEFIEQFQLELLHVGVEVLAEKEVTLPIGRVESPMAGSVLRLAV